MLPPEDFLLGSNLQKLCRISNSLALFLAKIFSYPASRVASKDRSDSASRVIFSNNLPLFNVTRNIIIICVRTVVILENVTAPVIINFLQVRRITRASEQWASLGNFSNYNNHHNDNFKKQLV